MCTREQLAFELAYRVRPSWIEYPGLFQDQIGNKRYVLPVWALRRWPKTKLLDVLRSVYVLRCIKDKDYPMICLADKLWPFEDRASERQWTLPLVAQPGPGRASYYALFENGKYVTMVHSAGGGTLAYGSPWGVSGITSPLEGNLGMLPSSLEDEGLVVHAKSREVKRNRVKRSSSGT